MPPSSVPTVAMEVEPTFAPAVTLDSARPDTDSCMDDDDNNTSLQDYVHSVDMESQVEQPLNPYAPFKSRAHLDLVLTVNHPRRGYSREQAMDLLTMLKASDKYGDYANLSVDDLYPTPSGPLAPQVEERVHNGIHYHATDLGKTIVQHLSLSRIRENLQLLPRLTPSGTEHTQRSQSKFARQQLAQPSTILNGHHLWVGQCIAFSSAGKGCYGIIDELVQSPSGDVMAIVTTCTADGDCHNDTAVVFASKARNHVVPGIDEPPVSMRLGIMFYSDETSANSSKKWEVLRCGGVLARVAVLSTACILKDEGSNLLFS